MPKYSWSKILPAMLIGDAYELPIEDMTTASQTKNRIKYMITEYCDKHAISRDTFFVGIMYNSKVIQVVRDC